MAYERKKSEWGSGWNWVGAEWKADDTLRCGGVDEVTRGMPRDELNLVMGIAKETCGSEKFAFGVGSDFFRVPNASPRERVVMVVLGDV